MKTAYRLLLSCATAATLVGFASAAKAETAAGSAAFSINNAGVVTGVAMSAAVSDVDTLSVAMNTEMGNATYALGSMTTITPPAWVRPADGNGQPDPSTEITGGMANIFVIEGEPEFYQFPSATSGTPVNIKPEPGLEPGPNAGPAPDMEPEPAL
jgi:hypothetical protein